MVMLSHLHPHGLLLIAMPRFRSFVTKLAQCPHPSWCGGNLCLCGQDDGRDLPFTASLGRSRTRQRTSRQKKQQNDHPRWRLPTLAWCLSLPCSRWMLLSLQRCNVCARTCLSTVSATYVKSMLLDLVNTPRGSGNSGSNSPHCCATLACSMSAAVGAPPCPIPFAVPGAASTEQNFFLKARPISAGIE